MKQVEDTFTRDLWEDTLPVPAVLPVQEKFSYPLPSASVPAFPCKAPVLGSAGGFI